jgi:hypothetical protein
MEKVLRRSCILFSLGNVLHAKNRQPKVPTRYKKHSKPKKGITPTLPLQQTKSLPARRLQLPPQTLFAYLHCAVINCRRDDAKEEPRIYFYATLVPPKPNAPPTPLFAAGAFAIHAG